ncbi:hypothetical protein ABPG72_012291 [Tetrahymena utriculariae]
MSQENNENQENQYDDDDQYNHNEENDDNEQQEQVDYANHENDENQEYDPANEEEQGDQNEDINNDKNHNYDEDEDGKRNELDDYLSGNGSNRNDKQDQQSASKRGSNFGVINKPDGNENYLRNKDILDNFFKQYQGEVQNYFNEFQQKQIQDSQDNGNNNFYSKQNNQQNQKEVSIVASDVPLVLRISFYYDNITFHPTKNDQEELFNKPNSYKSIMDQLQKFFAVRRNIRNFDPNETKVTYSDFVEFSYYFIENNDDLFLTQQGKEELWIQQQQENQLEKELRENIEKYENMLKKTTNPQEKLIIQNTIENLKQQLSLLLNKDQGKKGKANLTKEQIRMKNLKEAFNFYSKQQNITGVAFTFERIVHEQNVINLACFMLFLKQFNILNKNKYVTKREVQIMFKKYALNYKELDLDHFKIMIEKVAIAFYKDEENLNNIDKVEKLYQYIEIDNIHKFRSKFGLLNQPFNIQVKDGFRLLPFDQGRDIILKKVDPVVRQKVKKFQEFKKSQQALQIMQIDQKNLNQSKLAPRSMENNRRSTPNLQQSSVFSQHGGIGSYANKKIKNQIGKLDAGGKVSWQQLEQLSFTDMKNLNNGQFRPTDLFNENDDEEDKIYLAEYNLQEDRQRKMQEQIINKKGQENYGQIKEPVRPSLRYLQKHDPNYGKNGYSPSVGNLHRVHASAPEYYSPQNHMNQKQLAINQSYIQRAQQVDQDQRMKEQAMMQKIMNNHDLKVQRGMNAMNKRK